MGIPNPIELNIHLIQYVDNQFLSIKISLIIPDTLQTKKNDKNGIDIKPTFLKINI
jgi:hypothetical protein